MEKALNFYDELIDKTILLGGTVSAEHGIGKIKKSYLAKMYPDSLESMKNVKLALDSNYKFNDGNLF